MQKVATPKESSEEVLTFQEDGSSTEARASADPLTILGSLNKTNHGQTHPDVWRNRSSLMWSMLVGSVGQKVKCSWKSKQDLHIGKSLPSTRHNI